MDNERHAIEGSKDEQKPETRQVQVERLVMCEPPDIENAVKYLAKYIATYDRQHGYTEYGAKTYIDDVLYGLGVSLNDKEFSFANGFQKFKQELKKYLDT